MPQLSRVAPRPSLLNRLLFWTILILIALSMVQKSQDNQTINLHGWNNITEQPKHEGQVQRAVRPFDWHNLKNFVKLDYAIIKVVNATSFSSLSPISRITAFILPNIRWQGIEKLKGEGEWLAEGPRVYFTLLLPFGKIVALRIQCLTPFKLNLKGIRRRTSPKQSQAHLDLKFQKEGDLYWLQSEWKLEYLGIIMTSPHKQLSIKQVEIFGQM